MASISFSPFSSWPTLTIAINLSEWTMPERVQFLSHTHHPNHLLVDIRVPENDGGDYVPVENVAWFDTHWVAPTAAQDTRKRYLVGHRSLQMLHSLTQHRRVYIDVRASCVRAEQADAVQRLLDGYYLSCTTQPSIASDDSEVNSPLDIKLPHVYYVNGSISSWRVLMTLHAKQVPFTAQRLRVMCEPKETRSAAFLAINPRGKTPVLVDSKQTVVCNSIAILLHLEQTYPTPSSSSSCSGAMLSKLLESDQIEIAFQDLELLFDDDHQSNAAKHSRIVTAWQALLVELRLWETYLVEHAQDDPCVFTCNIHEEETPTLADCAFYPVIGYLVHHQLDLVKHGFPKLAAYAEAMSQLSCVRRSQPVGWRNTNPRKSQLLGGTLTRALASG
jgi:glutathione S-transferase